MAGHVPPIVDSPNPSNYWPGSGYVPPIFDQPNQPNTWPGQVAQPTSSNVFARSNGVITYNSYAGTDIVAEIVLPGEKPMVLGELQTISYSIHRENSPVRIIGHVNPTGFVKGPRTIAGSLIFTLFDEYAFYRLMQYQIAISNGQYPLADMLPPFDVTITAVNEYSMASKMRILGVTIADEGGTMSVDDLILEQTYTYMARGIQPMTNIILDRLQ